MEELSKHRMKLPLYDLEPRTENSWIAPSATISKKGIQGKHFYSRRGIDQALGIRLVQLRHQG